VSVSAGPKESYLAHKGEIDVAVQRVLMGGRYILGKEVSEFEKEFSDYMGGATTVGVGSGTQALEMALRVCGIGHRDSVVTVSHTATATVAAIQLVGANAILVDVDPVSQTMDPHLLNETLKARWAAPIKAIVPVHLYGQPAEMGAILEIAQRYGLPVIEDCAQSHGAMIGNRKAGTFGTIGAFSFYPTKNLGCLGDGGALVATGSIAEDARAMREYGWSHERHVSQVLGMNSRLDEIQAAVLRVKLRYLDRENDRRRRVAGTYAQMLNATQLSLPVETAGTTHVFHQYVVKTPARSQLIGYLRGRGIPTTIHYPLPVHLQPGFARSVTIGKGGLTNTETLSPQILSLPIHPHLSEREVVRAADLIREWSGSRQG